jgi:TetR/AcrR family transcriptional regulator, mexXY operon repressor
VYALARKTKEDSQRTRDLILDAAEQVIYARGISLTTMANIADAAQVSRGAVYGHYKGKVELAIAMAERALQNAPALERGPEEPALVYLKRYCLHEVHSYIEASSLQRVLFILYVRIDDTPELVSIRERWEQKRATIITQCLQAAIQEGSLAAESDVALYSLYVQAQIEGIFSILFFNHSFFNDDAAANKWEIAERLCAMGLERLTQLPR